MGIFSKLLWFSTKVGLCAGSVYLTVDQGIWGKPEKSIEIYNKIYNLSGFGDIKKEYLDDYFPKRDIVDTNFRQYWNSGVLYTFKFLSESPEKIGSLTNYITDSISSLTAVVEEKSKDSSVPEANKQSL